MAHLLELADLWMPDLSSLPPTPPPKPVISPPISRPIPERDRVTFTAKILDDRVSIDAFDTILKL